MKPISDLIWTPEEVVEIQAMNENEIPDCDDVGDAVCAIGVPGMEKSKCK